MKWAKNIIELFHIMKTKEGLANGWILGKFDK